MRKHLWLILLPALAVALALALPNGGSTVEAQYSTCRLNSDCQSDVPGRAVTECRSGQCRPRPCQHRSRMQPTRGSNPDCGPDATCTKFTGARTETWLCVYDPAPTPPPECQRNTQCNLGELCHSNSCVVDLAADRDRDGLPDGSTRYPRDNCPDIANSDQSNVDRDSEGDACDRDIDGDGRANNVDNCKFDYNPRQVDRDEDGKGDACDFDNL